MDQWSKQASEAAWEAWQPTCPNNRRHGATRRDPKGGVRCDACASEKGRHARRWTAPGL